MDEEKTRIALQAARDFYNAMVEHGPFVHVGSAGEELNALIVDPRELVDAAKGHPEVLQARVAQIDALLAVSV